LVDAVHRHPSLAWLDLSEKSIGPDTREALVLLLMEDIDGIAGTTTSHLAGLTFISGGIQDAEMTKLASALYSNSIIFIIFCLRDYILSSPSERKAWYSSVLFRFVPCAGIVRTLSYNLYVQFSTVRNRTILSY
jgi:hypothetical protein